MTSALGLDYNTAFSGTQDGVDEMVRNGRQDNHCWSVSKAEVIRLGECREAGQVGEANVDILNASEVLQSGRGRSRQAGGGC